MHVMTKLVKMEVEKIVDGILYGYQYVKYYDEIYKVRTGVTFDMLQKHFNYGVSVKDMYLTNGVKEEKENVS